MKAATLALALTLGLSGVAAAPILAQAQPAAPPAPRELKVSSAAFKPLKELEAAVAANDRAAIPAKLAAARAVAKTRDEQQFVAQQQLKAAIAASDLDALDVAIDAMTSTGAADQAALVQLYRHSAEQRFNAKQFDRAAASLERLLALEPSNVDVPAMLAETRFAQGRSSEAVALFRKAIAMKSASGVKPDEKLYTRALAIAFKANLPETVELSRQWVAAFPTVANWRDALRIYRQVAKPGPQETLDALRLARATGALESEQEHALYIYEASDNGAPGEAKAVLAEATAAGAIDPKSKLFAELDRPVRMQAAGESVNLSAKTAAALSGAAAGPALAAGDSHFGRGDYAKAVELYRAALAKSGADSDRINLHLGMALARQGDKAGAMAALGKVGGARAEIAKYWLIYASTLR